MHSVLTTLAQFSTVGYVLIGVGIVAIIISVVVSLRQRALTLDSGYDDPEHDDPEVYGVRRVRIAFLVAGAVFAVLGGIIAASPGWSTIF